MMLEPHSGGYRVGACYGQVDFSNNPLGFAKETRGPDFGRARRDLVWSLLIYEPRGIYRRTTEKINWEGDGLLIESDQSDAGCAEAAAVVYSAGLGCGCNQWLIR